ncbi:MAG: hypothetical protein HY587_08240 [Candidatus Omnitrophica bacterium]|nr:hypothetical protein [Candidatus Omnitrophota bacterium]
MKMRAFTISTRNTSLFLAAVLVFVTSLFQTAFGESREQLSAQLEYAETAETYDIPGGPPAPMLRDFHEMFPDWDFYEEPSPEMKTQFTKKYPLWGLVIRRIESDDRKRMRAEEFFDRSGKYPTPENHGEIAFEEYLMDYLEYEKEGGPSATQSASTDLEAEIRALFPGWTGGAVTPEMEEKFKSAFSERNFGSWNPLFYGDIFEEDYADEEVDEGLIYEEEESKGFPEDDWLYEEAAGNPEKEGQAIPEPTPTP